MCYSKTNLSPNYQLLSVFSSRICSNTSLLMLRGLSYQELWNFFLPWAFACRSGSVFCCMYELVPSHLLTFPPVPAVPPQFRLWAFLGPNLPLPRHVWFCHCCYSSCFYIFCCRLCRLNVVNHFSHLAFANLSHIFTRCLSNNHCPSFHFQGFPYIHDLFLTSSWLSFQTQSLSPLAAPDLSLRQRPQCLFFLAILFGVHQKPFIHFTVLSFCVLPLGVHRSILGTEVLYTNIGQ